MSPGSATLGPMLPLSLLAGSRFGGQIGWHNSGTPTRRSLSQTLPPSGKISMDGYAPEDLARGSTGGFGRLAITAALGGNTGEAITDTAMTSAALQTRRATESAATAAATAKNSPNRICSYCHIPNTAQ